MEIKQNKNLLRIMILTALFFIVYTAVPLSDALSQTQEGYKLLAPLPHFGETYTPGNGNFAKYVDNIIKLSITVAAVLGVIMIVIGGFQYMGGESLQSKSAGKERIRDAILGIVILSISFLILNTINPAILNFTLEIKPTGAGTASKTPAPTQSGVQKEATQTGYDVSTVPSQQMTPQEWAGKKGDDFRARRIAAGAAFGNSRAANTFYTNGQGDCLINTKIEASTPTYQDFDLQNVGQSIQKSYRENPSARIEIPIRSGSDQEKQNISSQCRVNTAGSLPNAFIDSSKKVYYCA